MKKILLFIISLFFTINVNALENYKFDSDYVFVYDVLNDKVVYELNSKEQIPIASVTKLMTSIIAIENNEDFEKIVTIEHDDFKDVYTYATAGFNIGDKLTVKELLYATLLPSGSEAANALVRITSGSESEFVKLMNEKVKELGLKNTSFSNPIGRDKDNYSSVEDVSKILKYALNNTVFKEIFTTETYEVNDILLKGPLTRTGTGIICGAKTGYTDTSLFNLASFSQTDDYFTIVVTAHANSYKEAMDDHKRYYNNYYNYKTYNYKFDFDINIKNGKEKSYNVQIDTEIYYDDEFNPSLLSYVYEGQSVKETFEKGDKLGSVVIYYDYKRVEEIYIYLTRDIKYKDYTLNIVLVIILIPLLGVILYIRNKSKKQST